MEVAILFLRAAPRQALEEMHERLQCAVFVLRHRRVLCIFARPGSRARRNVFEVIEIRASALESSVVITRRSKFYHCVKATPSSGQLLSSVQCFHIKFVRRALVYVVAVRGIAHEWCVALRFQFI